MTQSPGLDLRQSLRSSLRDRLPARGWTTPEVGLAYEKLLREQVFPGIAGKGVDGYKGIELLRRALPSGELEFMTIMKFESLDAVEAFAGEDYERAYVPPEARQLLARFDEISAHYEVLEQIIDD